MQRFHIHRFEFKYVLSQKQYQAIKEELLNYTDYDPYCLRNSDKSYMVYSLYYDSPNYSAFWDKIDGLNERSKFRFRVYDINPQNLPDVYLEIKHKKNFVITKDRAKLNYEKYVSSHNSHNLEILNYEGIPLDQKKVVDSLIYNALRFNFRPAIFVAYKREAFIGKHHANIRITFDRDIKSYKTDSLFLKYKQPDTVLSRDVILELKFNGSLPWWFHHFIQKYDLAREAHSKYCNSLIRSYNIII